MFLSHEFPNILGFFSSNESLFSHSPGRGEGQPGTAVCEGGVKVGEDGNDKLLHHQRSKTEITIHSEGLGFQTKQGNYII